MQDCDVPIDCDAEPTHGIESMDSFCPLCGKYYPPQTIESHASACLNDPEFTCLSPQAVEKVAGGEWFVDNKEDIDDAEYARKIQEEDEKSRKRKQEEEERLFYEFLKREEEEQSEIELRKQSETLPKCEICQCVITFELMNLDSETSTYVDVYYLENCTHVFCRGCITTYIEKQFNHKAVLCSFRCPTCNQTIAASDLQTLLSQNSYDKLLNNELHNLVTSNPAEYVICPKCQYVIERHPLSDESIPEGSGDLVVDGIQMSIESYRHRNLNRFRCRSCSTEFCAECQTIPYHLGKTCEEFKQYKTASKCRFCEQTLSHAKKKFDLIKSSVVECCDNEECERKNNLVCQRTLRCGHPCNGLRNESKCLPCLQESCPKHTVTQTHSDFCAICYVEPLSASPSIQLECGHIFHYICVHHKLLKRWPGARITFGFMTCPTCKSDISHKSVVKELKEIKALQDDVRKRASMRLSHEGLDRSPAITDPKSKYYQKPQQYADEYLCYYQCYVCKKPYFGGFKSCQNFQDDEEGKEFNPAELVCGGCVPNQDQNQCKTHGTEFIEFKCKFCCNVAQWFCWGNTHFCTSCHRLQENGEYLTRKKKEDLPKCEGKQKCPLKIDHPPNGTEFALGCIVCRKLNLF